MSSIDEEAALVQTRAEIREGDSVMEELTSKTIPLTATEDADGITIRVTGPGLQVLQVDDLPARTGSNLMTGDWASPSKAWMLSTA